MQFVFLSEALVQLAAHEVKEPADSNPGTPDGPGGAEAPKVFAFAVGHTF